MFRFFIAAMAAVTGMAGQTSPPQTQPAPAPPAAPAKPTTKKKMRKKTTATAQNTAPHFDGSQLPPARNLTPAEQKLDDVLIEWVRAYKSGGDEAAKGFAASKSIKLENNGLWVKLTGNFDAAGANEKMPPLLSAIKDLGGTVRTTFENRVYVLLSPKAVAQLAESETVWSMAVDVVTTRPLTK